MAALVAIVAVAAGAVTVLSLREEKPPPVTPAEARSAAEASCSDIARFEELVAANARLDDVRKALGRAERQAEVAARGDAVWVALAGGVQSVRVALDANDARAARVGIDVVRSECRRTKP